KITSSGVAEEPSFRSETASFLLSSPSLSALLKRAVNCSGNRRVDTQQANTKGSPVNFFHSRPRSSLYLKCLAYSKQRSPIITAASPWLMAVMSNSSGAGSHLYSRFHAFAARIRHRVTELRER